MEDQNDGKKPIMKVDQETKMGKKVIPFDKSKRSVKELVKDLQADMEEILIAKIQECLGLGI